MWDFYEAHREHILAAIGGVSTVKDAFGPYMKGHAADRTPAPDATKASTPESGHLIRKTAA